MKRGRRLKCPQCDRTFKLPAHLGRHMATIHAPRGSTPKPPIEPGAPTTTGSTIPTASSATWGVKTRIEMTPRPTIYFVGDRWFTAPGEALGALGEEQWAMQYKQVGHVRITRGPAKVEPAEDKSDATN